VNECKPLAGGGGGGKTPTPGSRASSRLRPNMAGVVRTDYEEMQVLQELQAHERQGLTLVHVSAQLELCLTHTKHPTHPTNPVTPPYHEPHNPYMHPLPLKEALKLS